MMQLRSSRITRLALLASVGILLSYIESLFILPVKIPGIKIGLSNIVSVVSVYLFGPLDALCVLLVRVFISALLFGNGISILFSVAGAIISYVVMLIFYKNRFISCLGVSVLAGVAHNITQLLVAMITVDNINLLYYLPALVLAGVLAGSLVGIVSNILITRLKKTDFVDRRS